MALSMIAGSALSYAPVASVAAPAAARAVSPQMGFGKAELEALAKEQNPVLGYWDPIGLADIDLWGQGSEASIGTRATFFCCTSHSNFGCRCIQPRTTALRTLLSNPAAHRSLSSLLSLSCSLAASRRDQARPHCDGRLRRLHGGGEL